MIDGLIAVKIHKIMENVDGDTCDELLECVEKLVQVRVHTLMENKLWDKTSYSPGEYVASLGDYELTALTSILEAIGSLEKDQRVIVFNRPNVKLKEKLLYILEFNIAGSIKDMFDDDGYLKDTTKH